MQSGYYFKQKDEFLPLRSRPLLSPPIPAVNASTALTRVRHPPRTAPSGSKLGLPSLRMPILVVVPPTSTMIASFSLVSVFAPMMDLRVLKVSSPLAVLSLRVHPFRDPSPFTIIKGVWISSASCTFFIDDISSTMTGISLAFKTAVIVRSLNPSAEESS